MSSSRNPEEEVAPLSDGGLEEANSHIKEVFVILDREMMKVRKGMEAFDAVAKKFKHVHFSKTLKLNVGGQLFSTSLETMKKDPGICSPMLMNFIYFMIDRELHIYHLFLYYIQVFVYTFGFENWCWIKTGRKMTLALIPVTGTNIHQ